MDQPIYKSADPLVSEHLSEYRTALETGKEVFLHQLTESYTKMSPLLHRSLNHPKVDLDALNYCAQRLPKDIFKINKYLLGQSRQNFLTTGHDISTWKKCPSTARRRLTYINSASTILASILNSDSDIDDIINSLISYYLEYLKIKKLLNGRQSIFLAQNKFEWLGLNLEEFEFFKSIFNSHFQDFILSTVGNYDLKIQLINPDKQQYQDNVAKWWLQTSAKTMIFNLSETPVYFVSSNSHSLINIIGGYLNFKQNYVFDYLSKNQPDLYNRWFQSKMATENEQINDFLYYMSNKYLSANPEFVSEKKAYEKSLGIIEIPEDDLFPTDVQLIPLKSLIASRNLDKNLRLDQLEKLTNSKALIINIQYPLGLAASYLLEQILKYFNQIKGVYIIGKAAIFNGSIGDIQIPEVVLDEITSNTIQFKNIFNDYFPFESHVSQIHKNQKAVCVYGTYLETKLQMEMYLNAGYNIVEMESSHFLNAMVNKYQTTEFPIDFGIINYASDNPLVENLGQETLTFRSIESTYLSSLTVLQRIVDQELARTV
ncbi:MAG TPA: hypothetical protein PK370_03230 [Candidatus Woesebacteria bacterium]|nr:hypothetical protein [Candidatus Woesebacteria bacterium]